MSGGDPGPVVKPRRTRGPAAQQRARRPDRAAVTPAAVAQHRDPAAGDLLAVDPSVRSPGAALFRGGALRAAGRVKLSPESLAIADDGARWLRVAHELAAWACGCGADPATLVYERPQIYQRGPGRSKGDPNVLLGLAGVGSALAGILAMGAAARDRALEVRTFLPAEWIGQLPKSTTGDALDSARSRLIVGSLTEEEGAIVPSQHDAIDAIGLGLFCLDRLKIRRAYHGASGGCPGCHCAPTCAPGCPVAAATCAD